MSDDRPLHVRVAEALGWTYLGPSEVEDGWEGEPPDAFELLPDGIRRRLDQHVGVPRYDLDWSATGPLIERFKLNLYPWSDGSWVADSDFSAATAVLSVDMEGSGATPLIAVCNLVLALAAAGKLDA
mgnify:FL=1